MISVASCSIALLLTSVAFAAPAPSSAASSVVVSATSSSTVPSVPVSGSSLSPTTSIAAATPSSIAVASSSTATVPFIDLNPNGPLWDPSVSGVPQPERGSLGATIIGPTDVDTTKANPDLLAPPTTDHGSVDNAKWAFSLSHNRLQTGGWAREQNIGVMPIATEMASVNMRLEPGAVRELHWHKTAEASYFGPLLFFPLTLKRDVVGICSQGKLPSPKNPSLQVLTAGIQGHTQVTAVDQNGRNFIGTVGPGDLWYFPAGIPHSLQATGDDPEGSEFILVFDSGAFSEDSTFLLTDWMSHVPVEVLAKNFQTDISAFARIPAEELYIFLAGRSSIDIATRQPVILRTKAVPPDNQQDPISPEGTVPNPFTFALSKVPPMQLSGGTAKIVDSTTFTVSKAIAAAEVTIEPGAIRELHWHPTQDEWSFFIEGRARMTIFASQSNARTFDYQAGDIGYVPGTMGHYVENIGNTTVRYLEIFHTAVFEDISLSNWLALTPPELVKAHLGFDDATMAHLAKVKPIVVGPA
ncbi:hypothetical protein NLJ89_g1072 [Agrocybe chaxingu]|uniref:Cupin type-1 domain-containing protein n=1 Tax=Agrocybe chaxingu TaxID=84603 RepID=A0A9W8N0P5_9AGAR|nr:hypothetical protein NLJ89_g1072 [Agrocybe chaxingu]